MSALILSDKTQRSQYLAINLRALELGLPLPDLHRPQSVNEKIQWCKLYDQKKEAVSLSDKREAKKIVAESIGPGHVIPNLAEFEAPGDVTASEWDALPRKFILKPTHDSGSTLLVDKGHLHDRKSVLAWMEEKSRRIYGVPGVEWPYWHISPAFIAEPVLNDIGKLETDYKFHCAMDKVRFVQVISDRQSGGREAIFDENGSRLPHQLDLNFAFDNNLTEVPGFLDMKTIAERLAKGWKYLRVDLYHSNETVWFGELTFFPYEGFYKGPGQRALGQLLPIDTSTTRETCSEPLGILPWVLGH